MVKLTSVPSTKITSSELLQIVGFLEESHTPIQNIPIHVIKSRYKVAKSYLEDWNFLKAHVDELCNHDNLAGPCIIDGKNLEEVRHRIWPNSGNEIRELFDEKTSSHFWPVSHFCDYALSCDGLKIKKKQDMCQHCFTQCLFEGDSEYVNGAVKCGISALKKERGLDAGGSLSSDEMIGIFEKYVTFCEKFLLINECDMVVIDE